ncbi:MAG: response regulator [Agathobacter sp.]|nr:response regulator [Agathobacter sp.]
MQVRRVLNMEDSIPKHMDVRRSLERYGVQTIHHATNANDGLDMIEAAIAEGIPYDLIVTDMYFPRSKGGPEVESGSYIIDELQRREIEVPVIVCSSARIWEPRAVGCIHYNKHNILDEDMRELIDLVKSM